MVVESDDVISNQLLKQIKKIWKLIYKFKIFSSSVSISFLTFLVLQKILQNADSMRS